MKRTRLVRRTPLTSHTGLRRTPLQPVSKQRRRDQATRTAVLAAMRDEQDWCSRCGRTGLPLDGHELLSRARGGSITDRPNIVLIDRFCHDYITTHPAVAAAEGWALPSWEESA